jgi:ActR/RegA family two-component response regulator
MLLVDDDDRVARSLARTASTVGIDLVHARTIAAAKQALEAGPFAAAIVDLSLDANESGLDLVEWMRGSQPTVARVLASGSPRPDGFAIVPPIQQFLQKPFGRQELDELRDSLQA